MNSFSLKKKYNLAATILIIVSLLLFFQQVTYGEDEIQPKKILDNGWTNYYSHSYEKLDYTITPLSKTLQLITFKEDNNPATGYLLTMSNGNGKRELLEYGFGNHTPYMTNIILNEKLTDRTPDRFVYLNPIESYWFYSLEGENVYVDSTSGEWLPDLTQFDKEYSTNKDSNFVYASLSDKIVNSYVSDKLIFNPFDDLSWLVDDQLKSLEDPKQIKALLLNNTKIMYVGEKFEKEVKMVYPVIGYAESNHNIYIAIYDTYLSITRFILIEELKSYGKFLLLY